MLREGQSPLRENLVARRWVIASEGTVNGEINGHLDGSLNSLDKVETFLGHVSTQNSHLYPRVEREASRVLN
jgi:hypothetical protein